MGIYNIYNACWSFIRQVLGGGKSLSAKFGIIKHVRTKSAYHISTFSPDLGPFFGPGLGPGFKHFLSKGNYSVSGTKLRQQ